MNAQDNTTIVSFKTKKRVKELAQLRAKQLGIPLGTLVNAFLRNLGQTGGVHFIIAESITPSMAQIIEEMRKEVTNGGTSGPFTLEEAESFLDSLPRNPVLLAELQGETTTPQPAPASTMRRFWNKHHAKRPLTDKELKDAARTSATKKLRKNL